MSAPVLAVENLSKKYCRSLKRSLWYGVRDLAGELLLRSQPRAELRRDEFWALQDVSLELCPGETLGLIGHNGAGKSTLLKLINGLLKPDLGRVCIRGRIGALIELGAGFNPILTGRENIYVNAAVLGLGRKEVQRRLPQIIDFAEIGAFLDTPVQSYSSGMKARLGFAIAAHLDPDLLLIDEVLSVGDASFRQRCVDRLAEYRLGGGTIIFVSHNTTVVEKICDRVMLLDHGKVANVGDPGPVVRKYEAQALELNRQADERLRRYRPSPAAEAIRILEVWCRDPAGRHRQEFDYGQSFEVCVRYELTGDLRVPYFVIVLQNAQCHERASAILNMMWDSLHREPVPRRGVVSCRIPDPPFAPGLYRIQVGVQSQPSEQFGAKWHLQRTELGSFTVLPGALKDRLPGIPSIDLTSYPASTVVDYSWCIDGNGS